MQNASRFAWSLALALAAGASAQDIEPIEHQGEDFTARVVKVRSHGRGSLGVQLTPLSPELRAHFGVPGDTGVLVARVDEGGPAEAAGIRVADILATIDGERIGSTRDLARMVRGKKEGDLVTIELYRDGSLQSLTVTVSERDRPVIDLAGGYRFFPDMDELAEHDFVIGAPGFRLDEESMKAFEEAMRGLEDHLESPEWREKLERIETLDFTAIQERMREVERRLEELERELEEESREER